MNRLIPLLTLSLVVAGVTPAGLAQELRVQHPRAILISFDPIIEAEGDRRLHNVCGWNDSAGLTQGYMSSLTTSSYGLMNYRLNQHIRADMFSLNSSGFRYTDAEYIADWRCWCDWETSLTDYKAIARDYDLARKVEAGLVDEVFVHGCPFLGYYESTMCGRGGYWCNSSPRRRIASSKIFIMMGFNYERGVGEMLEDYGHRAESILSRTYGYDTNTWTVFARYDKLWPGQSHCGNVHFAPNSQGDYDWGNQRYVWSYCDDWLYNFPNLQGTQVYVNCSEWGNGDMRLHHMWWFEHMPHVAGSLTEYGRTRLNNWWEYMQNFNHHTDSGGDFGGGTPLAVAPHAAPQRMLTDNGRDDWCPQVNADGLAVWHGHDGADFEIFAGRLDGSQRVQITSNAFQDEMPKINAAGRIVWQAFDGQDYEIFSANADGTDLVQITDNTLYDWHPDINDAGIIVWDRFDGQDYEIFSANADGSNVVQITDNAAASGQPRDDVWPQINNADPARVVWFGHDGNDWEIFSAYADGTDLVNVSDDWREEEYPHLNDNNVVVWMRYDSDTDVDICAASALGGPVTQLSPNGAEDWWPRINNSDQVVWMTRSGGAWRIATAQADGSGYAELTPNASHNVHPRIADDGRIAWQGWDGQDWEIYVRQAGVIEQVTDNELDDRWVALAGDDTLVWHGETWPADDGPTTTEIFAAGSLTVDVTPPALESVQATSAREVRVTFSEAVEAASAQTPGNYEIAPGVTVLDATLHVNRTTVFLTTTTLESGTTYTLAVSGVTDEALNPVPADTQAEFEYQAYTRVTDGLVAVYGFDEGEGTVVHDVSEVATPLDLNIASAAAVTWTATGLRLDAPTRVMSAVSATKIISACSTSDEITLEAWIVPASADQYGPARIAGISASTSARNITLGQGQASAADPRDVFDVRLRTTTTDGNGVPSTTTSPGVVSPALTHVAYTRAADGTARIYVDGVLVKDGRVDGDLSSWNPSYRLILGNELLGNAPWLGEYRLVAVYDRALALAEVSQNFLAGPLLAPPTSPGDCDCDGDVDFFDIDYFLHALSGEAAWHDYYVQRHGVAPPCGYGNCDCDQNGAVDFFDIDTFLDLLGT